MMSPFRPPRPPILLSILNSMAINMIENTPNIIVPLIAEKESNRINLKFQITETQGCDNHVFYPSIILLLFTTFGILFKLLLLYVMQCKHIMR